MIDINKFLQEIMRHSKKIPFPLLFIVAVSAIAVHIFHFNFSVNLGLLKTKRNDVIVSWLVKICLLAVLFIMFLLPQILITELNSMRKNFDPPTGLFILRVGVIYVSLLVYRGIFTFINQILGAYVENNYIEQIYGQNIEEIYRENNINLNDPDGEHFFEINYFNKIVYTNYKILSYIIIVPLVVFFVTIKLHYISIVDCLVGVFIAPLVITGAAFINFHKEIDRCVTCYYSYKAQLLSPTKRLQLTNRDYYYCIGQLVILSIMLTIFNVLIYLILHVLDSGEFGIFQRAMHCGITVLLIGFIFKYVIRLFFLINRKIF